MNLLVALLALQDARLEFFEKRIRPVLVRECYSCHSENAKVKGGLRLDLRDGPLKGGDSGPALVPGDPARSLLLRAIRHEDPDLKMPAKAPKLDAATIRDFERWVADGAADPREKASPAPAEGDFREVLGRRKEWWSFKPLADPPLPEAEGVRHPVDRFLRARLAREGVRPAPDADPRRVGRRLAWLLAGLPPTPEELAAFEAAWIRDPDVAVAAEVDRLLASPRYGERWGRHWLDVVRYGESHGSEGDPKIPYAWRYRDWVIRAFNEDLPFDAFVREQIAGDLLESPRLDAKEGLNLSAFGTGHLRMVLHGFSPVDSLDERVTFVDNQIDAVSKAFLGLTVSCARCHDHKFDPISQADWTALYGIFAAGRPAVLDAGSPERRTRNADRIRELKERLRSELAALWRSRAADSVEGLAAVDPKNLPGDGLLGSWSRLLRAAPDRWAGEVARLREQDADRARRLEAFRKAPAAVRWDLRGEDLRAWTAEGAAAAPAGTFTLHAAGEAAVSGIFPAGVVSHRISDRLRGFLASPSFDAPAGRLWIRGRGSKARTRYVVQNYPRTGTVHHKADLDKPADGWVSWSLDYWKGERIHVEISTQADAPLEGGEGGSSWFAVSEVALTAADVPSPPSGPAFLTLLGHEPIPDVAALKARTLAALDRALEAWGRGDADDEQAELLGTWVREGRLPNRLAELGPLRARIEELRRLEAEIPAPVRVPGVIDADTRDEPLFHRGDHRRPSERTVPRRFLEAFGGAPFALAPGSSGRRELAESLVATDNPLPARVYVNRVWQHLFGRGLVATPDNFGRLGDPPTHPDLLDWLARRFRQDGGSTKALIRLLATSKAFRADSRPSAEAASGDPANLLLSRFEPRRLEAEAIRDGILALSGTLDPALGGPSVGGETPRRSVYVRVVRNALDPFLAAFDFPSGAAPRGRRDATNVPAQSLSLMNDPQVAGRARDWARRILRDPRWTTAESRITRLFEEAYGRPPREDERVRARAFVSDPGAGEDPWWGLARALIHSKEYFHVR
jgi:hypothetical protein